MALSVNDSIHSIHPCYNLQGSNVLENSYSLMCILLHILIGSLSFITVCGNLLVIISIIYFKQLHTPTNYLTLSLAVADLLVGFLAFPFTIKSSEASCPYNNDIFCKVRTIVDVSLCTSSILNLCCISIDRYYSVCQPLTYRAKISDKVVGFMILVSWSISALIGISFIISSLNRRNCDKTCFNIMVIANILGLVFTFYAPVFIMLCIYFKIFLVAQKQARSIQNTKCGVSKMERKATKTLAIVMGVFLMCWLPFFICTTIRSFIRVSVPLALLETLNWFALTNSLLNPFIYAFFYSWFRAAFRMIMSGKIIQGNFTNLKLL